MSQDSSSEKKWSHRRIWQEQCRRRLQENPFDLDALFAKAVWLAKANEYKKSIECLDITKRDSSYPCVWMFKAKVYSQLGNEKMARLCQERGEGSNLIRLSLLIPTTLVERISYSRNNPYVRLGRFW